jgi:3-oxoacyl-[acyl-carrier-protein] synthase I
MPLPMKAATLAIHATGLVTSVGLGAPASCAAMRAKISNPSETRFISSVGEWILAHQVTLEKPWRGMRRLERMAAMAVQEAMAEVPTAKWGGIPLLLCVAERERPGRMEALDDKLLVDIMRAMDVRFAPASSVIGQGRVSVAVALAHARVLVRQGFEHVLIAATDSLLSWPTLRHYEQCDRLLTQANSNGFMPGEGAGALLVGRHSGEGERLFCSGIGFGIEGSHVDSDQPLRADGLTFAIRNALAEAGCEMDDMDYRITDLSGEQYYFKEAALALSRTLRRRKEEFELWHPAECVGEAGAMAGAAVVALADAACRKGYTKGHNILAHMAGDTGQRAALVLRFGAPDG